MPLVATDYTLDGAEKPWSPPRAVTAEQHRAAWNALSELERQIQPAPRDWLSGRILALLGHYYVADADPAFSRAIARDWIMAVEDLPQAAVAKACDAWIRTEARKPKPADIRRRAIEAVGKPWLWRERLRRLVEVPTGPEARRRDEDRAPPHGSPKWRRQREAIDAILARAGIRPAGGG